MKIDGKAIATAIFHKLQNHTSLLKKENIIPHLAIILVGEDPASISYVKRKQAKAEEIGAKATIKTFSSSITNDELLRVIDALNTNASVHGIIVQRPLPKHINTEAVNQAVIPQKDIDAFHPHTPFTMPLARASVLLLEHVYNNEKHSGDFHSWLTSKNIVVIGKGETGGGPIITLLETQGIHPTIIDSKTESPEAITRQADIIISAVGKKGVITKAMTKKGVILLSIGQHKQTDGKFHGDYEEEEIKNTAAFYSPTPGGVGPVNVACLLENLLQALKIQLDTRKKKGL